MIAVLEWSGAIFGVLGALLLAFNLSFSRYGWLVFLIANIAMLGFTYLINRNALFVRELVFCGISLLGMYRSGLWPACLTFRRNP